MNEEKMKENVFGYDFGSVSAIELVNYVTTYHFTVITSINGEETILGFSNAPTRQNVEFIAFDHISKKQYNCAGFKIVNNRTGKPHYITFNNK